MSTSPTSEGFRAAFRRPSLTLAEISWRWTAGATAAALFVFALFEYLDTLLVTNGELLFLRSRQPYLVGEAIAHILRGSLNRVVIAGILGVFLLASLWIVAASVGRIATVRSLLDYFRRNLAGNVTAAATNDGEKVGAVVATGDSLENPWRALIRLNFLRVAVALSALLGLVGASILAGFASPEAHPRPGVAFFLFLPLAALVCLVGWALNWLLSLAGVFAVRDGSDAVESITAAISLCCERTGALFAVSGWTGLAHLVAFVGATMAASVPVGFVAVVPWRLVVAGMLLATLAYFTIADWLYMVRLAGYVCIAEMPEALLVASTPSAPPRPVGTNAPPVPPLETTIDQTEPILSDLPSPA